MTRSVSRLFSCGARFSILGYHVEDEDNDSIPKLDLNDHTDFPANFSPPQTQNSELETKVMGPSFAQVMKDDSYPALPRRQTATWSVETASSKLGFCTC